MHLAGLDFTAVSSARWEDSETFTIWIRANESIAERRFSFPLQRKQGHSHPDLMP